MKLSQKWKVRIGFLMFIPLTITFFYLAGVEQNLFNDIILFINWFCWVIMLGFLLGAIWDDLEKDREYIEILENRLLKTYQNKKELKSRYYSLLSKFGEVKNNVRKKGRGSSKKTANRNNR
jgi:hypothetical protein